MMLVLELAQDVSVKIALCECNFPFILMKKSFFAWEYPVVIRDYDCNINKLVDQG